MRSLTKVKATVAVIQYASSNIRQSIKCQNLLKTDCKLRSASSFKELKWDTTGLGLKHQDRLASRQTSAGSGKLASTVRWSIVLSSTVVLLLMKLHYLCLYRHKAPAIHDSIPFVSSRRDTKAGGCQRMKTLNLATVARALNMAEEALLPRVCESTPY